MAKYYGKIAKQGVMWGVARTGAIDLLNIPTSMVLARLLSPLEFGIFGAALFFMELGERLTSLGFNTALVRMKTIRPEHVSTLFVITVAVETMTWGVITAGAGAMAAWLNIPEAGLLLRVAALKFLIGIFGTVPLTLLARDLKFRERAIADSTMTVVYCVSAITFAAFGLSYWSLVYATFLKIAVRNVLLIRYSGFSVSFRFSRSAASEMFSVGMAFYAKAVLRYATGNVDNLVVAKVLGPVALGFYDKAFNVSTKLISRVLMAGPGVAFRIFALIHEEEARFRRAYRKLVMSLALVGLPGIAVVVIAARPLIEVMFGVPWLPVVEPFQILSAASLLTLVNSFANSAMDAKGLVWQQVLRQLGLVVLLVIFVAIGGNAAGLVGAAAGVFVARLANWFVIHQMLFHATQLTWRDVFEPQAPGLAAAALVTAVLLPLQLFLGGQWPALVMLPMLAFAAAAVFALFLWLHRFIEARQLVDEVLTDMAPAWLRRRLSPRFGVSAKRNDHAA